MKYNAERCMNAAHPARSRLLQDSCRNFCTTSHPQVFCPARLPRSDFKFQDVSEGLQWVLLCQRLGLKDLGWCDTATAGAECRFGCYQFSYFNT